MKLTNKEKQIMIDVCNEMATGLWPTCVAIDEYSGKSFSPLRAKYHEFFGQDDFNEGWDWDWPDESRNDQRLMCLATFLVLKGEVP